MSGQARIALKRTTAGQGATWIGSGFKIFGLAPWVWLGIIVIYFMLGVVAGLLPGGGLLLTLFGPVISGGLMLGCASLAQGGELNLEHLFAGFSGGHLSQLLLVGALVFVAGLLIAVFCLALALGSQWQVLLTGDVNGLNMLRLLWVICIGLLLYVPVLMAAWFAPALVVLGGQKGVDAMRLSFAVCLRHFGAFLVYGLLVLLFAFLASVPLMLGWLVMGPVFIASTYAAYCDLFEVIGPPEPLAL